MTTDTINAGEAQLDIEASLTGKLFRDQARKALAEALNKPDNRRPETISAVEHSAAIERIGEWFDLAKIGDEIGDALAAIRPRSIITTEKKLGPAEIEALRAGMLDAGAGAPAKRVGWFGRMMCALGRHKDGAPAIVFPGRDLPPIKGYECRRCKRRHTIGAYNPGPVAEAKTISRRKRQENKAAKWVAGEKVAANGD